MIKLSEAGMYASENAEKNLGEASAFLTMARGHLLMLADEDETVTVYADFVAHVDTALWGIRQRLASGRTDGVIIDLLVGLRGGPEATE
jgi:hypothetical protein